MRPTLSFGRRATYGAITVLLLLVLLAAIEGAVRLVTEPVPAIQALAVGRSTGMRSESGRQLFVGDVHRGWRLRANVRDVVWEGSRVSTNALGMRIAGAETPSSRDAVRILCLGDSVTFGYSVPRVDPRRPDRQPSALAYPFILQDRIAGALGRATEVSNMGTPGYTSYQGRAWLRSEIDRLRPHLVVISFGYNDTYPVPRPYKLAYSPGWLAVGGRHLRSRSQAAIRLSSGLRSLFASRKRAPLALRPAVAAADYLTNIRAMVELARTRNSAALVVGQVYERVDQGSERDRLIASNRTALAAYCRRHEIPYLEIEELTERSHPGNASLFGDPIHPDHRGHQLMASAIGDAILELALLPFAATEAEGSGAVTSVLP